MLTKVSTSVLFQLKVALKFVCFVIRISLLDLALGLFAKLKNSVLCLFFLNLPAKIQVIKAQFKPIIRFH